MLCFRKSLLGLMYILKISLSLLQSCLIILYILEVRLLQIFLPVVQTVTSFSWLSPLHCRVFSRLTSFYRPTFFSRMLFKTTVSNSPKEHDTQVTIISGTFFWLICEVMDFISTCCCHTVLHEHQRMVHLFQFQSCWSSFGCTDLRFNFKQAAYVCVTP